MKKKRKISFKNFDLIGKYQSGWVAELPWSQKVLNADGTIRQVKYIVTSHVEKKLLLMVVKYHTLF